MNKIFAYFKLGHSIKAQEEAQELAKLELEALCGAVRPVANVVDIIQSSPLSEFTGERHRIQDILVHELPYGNIHGYSLWLDSLPEVTSWVKRLAYSEEFFIVLEGRGAESWQNRLFPEGVIDLNVQVFDGNGKVLYRFITHQYFIEKSEYISRLSRNEREVERNVQILLNYPTKELYRIPATETSRVGRRLQDYFALREEPSLYLTHYFHPYKGKFHPKMARALLNYVLPAPKGKALDNFAGSGTLLVEASLMGLDSVGIEINPLSVLMSNVKCRSLYIPFSVLCEAIEEFLVTLSSSLCEKGKADELFITPKVDWNLVKSLPRTIVEQFSDPTVIQQVLTAREIIQRCPRQDIREFLLLALSGTISDLYRRTIATPFLEALQKRLLDLRLRLCLFHQLNKVLKIQVGSGITYQEDARDVRSVAPDSVDGVVTSPPYSTALDYIRNDEPQLRLLGLAQDIEELEEAMMGNPRASFRVEGLPRDLSAFDPPYLPTNAKETVRKLIFAGRVQEGIRTYKFWLDLLVATERMRRLQKAGSRAAVIIGDNHYLLGNKYEVVENDEAFIGIAEHLGYEVERVIKREIEKTASGNIRQESIVIIRKTSVD